MVLPVHLANRFYEQLSFYACTVSNFEQYTLARFIEKGYFEKHLNRMRNYYHNKRDFLLKCIEESDFAPFVKILFLLIIAKIEAKKFTWCEMHD